MASGRLKLNPRDVCWTVRRDPAWKLEHFLRSFLCVRKYTLGVMNWGALYKFEYWIGWFLWGFWSLDQVIACYRHYPFSVMIMNFIIYYC